jgi:ABC-2 type transport system permease protein
MASLCWALVTASIRGQMQYRLNFLFDIAFGLMFQGIGFIFILIVLGQFEEIGGWTLSEVALLYGMRLASHGLWTVTFSRLFAIDRIVRDGEFDRMLLRPMPMLLQLMFGAFRLPAIGDLLGGILVLGWALTRVDIDWSAGTACFFVAALAGGAMIDGAFQLGPAALSFRTLESFPVRWFFDDLFNRFGGYPQSIFGTGMRVALMWIVPVAFVAWLPATVVLGKTDTLPVPEWVAWCSPLIGLMLISLATWIFVRESRQYQSSGT